MDLSYSCKETATGSQEVNRKGDESGRKGDHRHQGIQNFKTTEKGLKTKIMSGLIQTTEPNGKQQLCAIQQEETLGLCNI